MADQVEDILARIARCDDAASVRAVLADTCEQLGYACYTYGDLRRLSASGGVVPYYMSTAPDGYINTYIKENLVAIDTRLQRAHGSNSPFFWSDCLKLGTRSHPSRRICPGKRSIEEVVQDFGYTQGYMIPCHGVDGYGRPASALISLFWAGSPDRMTPDRTPFWLRLVTSYCHERLLSLRGVMTAQEGVKLNNRELECLLWACRGKTCNETAEILHIAPVTVSFHISNATKKLGVSNKFHAVGLAVQLGLIMP